MSLINCKDNRNRCGVPYSSTCVSYQGSFVGILKDEKFECNVNVDDVIERLSSLIEKLKADVEILKKK